MARAKADPSYVRLREAQIPMAEALANAECGSSCPPHPGSAAEAKQALKAWQRRWDACFLREMENLVAEARAGHA